MVDPTHKILIIDDEEDINFLTSKRVRSAGYIVDSLFDGMKVMEKIREFRPTLVLLDIKMPGKSGFDVFKEIRVDSEFHNLPIVFISAYQEERDYCLKILKADGFIGKPFNPTELVSLIHSLLPN